MLQHGAVKISSAKLFSLVIAPGIALAGISSYLAWKLWEVKKQSPERAEITQQPNEETSHEQHASDDFRYGIFQQIIDENIALRAE